MAEATTEPIERDLPFGPDAFAKARQEQRAAAAEEAAGTAAPDDGGEDPVEEQGQVEEAAVSDDDLELSDGDGEDEPENLPVLEPPASMTADEKAAFEQADDELKGYFIRTHKAMADTARTSSETVAARNEEVLKRTAELDESLARAWAVLNGEIDTPVYSQEALDKILEDEGSDAWIKATTANTAAKAEAKQKLQEIQGQITERQKQIVTKFYEDLPKLIETWKDPEVAKKEAGELQKYLVDSGFSDSEVKQVADARLVRLGLKAMKYDRALKKNGKATKPKARPGPVGGRRPAKSTESAVQKAEKAYSEKPSGDTFAALNAAKRAAQSETKRRV